MILIGEEPSYRQLLLDDVTNFLAWY